VSVPGRGTRPASTAPPGRPGSPWPHVWFPAARLTEPSDDSPLVTESSPRDSAGRIELFMRKRLYPMFASQKLVFQTILVREIKSHKDIQNIGKCWRSKHASCTCKSNVTKKNNLSLNVIYQEPWCCFDTQLMGTLGCNACWITWDDTWVLHIYTFVDDTCQVFIQLHKKCGSTNVVCYTKLCYNMWANHQPTNWPPQSDSYNFVFEGIITT